MAASYASVDAAAILDYRFNRDVCVVGRHFDDDDADLCIYGDEELNKRGSGSLDLGLDDALSQQLMARSDSLLTDLQTQTAILQPRPAF